MKFILLIPLFLISIYFFFVSVMGILSSVLAVLSGRLITAIFLFFGYVLLAIGATGFLMVFWIEFGFFKLPKSVEYPIGASFHALRLEDGMWVVPHGPTGRIQIYEADKKFVHGWNVSRGVAGLRLFVEPDQTFWVYRMRTDDKTRYDRTGKVIGGQVNVSGKPDLTQANLTFGKPVPLYLWPFIHPVMAWMLLPFSSILLSIPVWWMKIGNKIKQWRRLRRG